MGVRNKAQKGPCYALEAVFSPPRVKYIGPLSTAPGKPHKSRLFCPLNAYIPGWKFKGRCLGKWPGMNIDIVNKKLYNPIFDSQIYQNTAESLILPGFFSGAFSFYYIVFFLNQIWMIDFYDFSRDCLLSFWISFIFLLVRNS